MKNPKQFYTILPQGELTEGGNIGSLIKKD